MTEGTFATLLEQVVERAAERPDRVAIVFGSERWTRSELVASVARDIDFLRAGGDIAATLVPVVLPDGPPIASVFLAVAGIGATALLLNPALTGDELEALFRPEDIRLVVTDRRHADVCRRAAGGNVTILELEDAPPIRDAARAFSRLVDELRADARLRSEGERPVIVQYSTGSSGRAKKVMKTQHNVLASATLFGAAVGLSEADVVACPLPLFHDFGFTAGMCASVLAGARLALLEPFRRDGAPVSVPFLMRVPSLISLVEEEQATILLGPPQVFAALAETPSEVAVDLSSVRLCISAGAPLPIPTLETFRRRFSLPVRSLYGSTETGCIAINLDPPEQVRADIVGPPIPGVDVRILDIAGERSTVGTIGEVSVRSESTIRGYPDHPELDALNFRDGYFLTGDLGRIDEEGRLEVTGRTKRFIDAGGEKVDPDEIEAVLRTHPAIAEVSVLGVPSPFGAEAIKAVVVRRGDVSDWDVLLFCREHLAAYKVPRFVEFRTELPRSPLGKLLRTALIEDPPMTMIDAATGGASNASAPAPLRAVVMGSIPSADMTAGAHRLERAMTAYLRDVLHDEVDPSRPLAELGLTSLLILELRAWLETGLRMTLSVTLLWDYPTVRELAAELARRALAADAPVVDQGSTADVERVAHADTHRFPASGAEDRGRTASLAEEVAALSDDEVHRQLEELTRQVLADGSREGGR